MSGSARRWIGLDVARGLAVILMIQTHAYDGWVLSSERASAGFLSTRWLAVLPLPLFLAITGMNVGRNVARADTARASREQLQRTMLSQAARILLTGYALNALYACLDGSRGVITFLRMDILHCIGLSVALLSMCLGRTTLVDRQVFARRAFILGALALALCPPLSQLAAQTSGSSLRWVLSPWLAVGDLNTMPVVPLAFFATTLATIGAYWPSPLPLDSGAAGALPGGAAWLTKYALGCVTLLGLGIGGGHLCAALGVPASRAHPSIWFNAFDLLGRAGCVLGLTLWCTRKRTSDVPVLSVLGRHSLLLYGLHLPFCYGSLARPLKHALTLGAASFWLMALLLLCWIVAIFREPRARTTTRAVSLRP